MHNRFQPPTARNVRGTVEWIDAQHELLAERSHRQQTSLDLGLDLTLPTGDEPGQLSLTFGTKGAQ